MLLDKLQEIFNEVTGQTDVTLTKKTKINDDIGLSSFARIRLLCAVEDEFGVEIPNQAIMGFKTVGDIIKYLNKNGIN